MHGALAALITKDKATAGLLLLRGRSLRLDARATRGRALHRIGIRPRLSAVTVAIVTRTEGPAQTHIPIDSESGLTGYDVSHVSATSTRSTSHGCGCGAEGSTQASWRDWNQPSAYI